VLPESITDALIECVKVCGGSKVVGVALWPAKGVEGAQRQLLACLNPDRNEKLGPEEVMLILRLARERGFHGGMQYIAAALNYAAPIAIEPEDEKAALQREFIESTRKLAKLAETIAQLDPRVRAVA
jgi:hypothetical protein